MRDGVLDAVVGCRHVVITAEHEDLHLPLLRHGRTQRLCGQAGSPLVPGPDVRAERVVHAGGPLQVAANVVLEHSDIGAVVGGQARVVFEAFAGGVRVHTEEPRIDAADGLPAVPQEFLEPALRADAKVRLFEVLGRESRQARQFLHDLLLFRGRDFVAFFERRRVLAMRELPGPLGDLSGREFLQVRRQQLVIPGGGDQGREEEDGAVVGAPVAEAHSGKQDHAVQINLMAPLQRVGELRGTRGSITLADQELGRRPTFVAREVVIK